MAQERNFIRQLSILFVWKKFIIINFLVIVGIAVGVSFILPKWYKATTTLIEPKKSDIFSSLGTAGSLLKGISSISQIGGLGQKSGSYNYFALLKSRSTMEKVIRKFDLISVYKIKKNSIEETLKELDGNVSFEDQEDNQIAIEVYDKDPVRAAEMANYFVEVLNEVNTSMTTQEARNNRMFIEQRLNETKIALQKAEDSLQDFQERTGLIITPDQSSGIDAVATLYSMKVKKEVEVAIMERSVTPNNSSLQQSRIELSELNKEVAKLPQTGIQSFRLYREVAIQQKIEEFLVPLYEQAKIDEHKDIPVLLTLDKAVPPEKKAKPQRVLIVFLTSILSFFFLVICVFFLHGLTMEDGDVDSPVHTLHNFAFKIASVFKVRIH